MASNFPKNILELSAAGYDWINVGECRGCHAPIQWYATPNLKGDGSRKRMPITILPDRSIAPHFAVCPARKSFQRANQIHAKRADKNPRPIQMVLPLE